MASMADVGVRATLLVGYGQGICKVARLWRAGRNEALLSSFSALLEGPAPQGRQKEQVVQDYLELHNELVPTPNLLNHHLQLNSIVSKYPLSTDLITDYLYLTKSSGSWIITLVELESPDKDIFTSDLKRATPTAPFTAALAQVMDWKSYVEDHKSELLERLAPLLVPHPMRRNPVSFEYQLIVGRSANKNLSPKRLQYIQQIRLGQGIDVITYDTLIGMYRAHQRYKKNVMRIAGGRFAFKSMLPDLHSVLSYLGPSELELTPEQEGLLVSEGYRIQAWRAGELLVVNGKLPMSADPAYVFGMVAPVK